MSLMGGSARFLGSGVTALHLVGRGRPPLCDNINPGDLAPQPEIGVDTRFCIRTSSRHAPDMTKPPDPRGGSGGVELECVSGAVQVPSGSWTYLRFGGDRKSQRLNSR